MRTPRRLLVPVLALLLLFAAACGDDDDAAADDASGETESSESAPGGDETTEDGAVTIEHAFGETVIEEVPSRIVTIGAQWNGVLLDMGAPIVGYMDDGYRDTPTFPWEEDLMPADAQVISTVDGIPYEQVAALDPDLIVVTHTVEDQAGYDALAAIAPTIPALGDRQVDLWQDLTTVAGQFMRDTAAAEAIIDDYDEMVASLVADYPSLDGKTYSFANYVPGDGIYVVADPDDGAARFFGELGLSIAPDLLAVADGATGRAQLSLEQAGLLDADVVMVLANGGDLSELVGFDSLPAVQAGAWMEATYDLAVAMNTPNAQSLRWALDQIRPALEAAA